MGNMFANMFKGLSLFPAAMKEWSLLCLAVCIYLVEGGVVLRTKLGELEGQQLATPSGRTYYSFTAIPYAQPPLGQLRLKNPVAQGKWAGRLDATKPAPLCKQIFIFIPALRNQVVGQEDCLYLNVYTPTTDKERKLPVVVYIHGGGFTCGSPGPAEAPTNFMEQDVVLVTVHYRLGVLGFLSTESGEIPGNYGLKDQAMAVQWVHENIASFGGDPALVMAFGESAGGASVHYLITSPLSAGYLQGAIAESGTVDAPWALSVPGRGRRTARALGEAVGCDLQRDYLQCLQNMDADRLLTVANATFLVWDFDPAVMFQPTVEVENDGAFMTEDPRKIELKKPFITGMVPGEGILKTAGLINQDPSILETFVSNIEEHLRIIMFLERDIPRLDEFINVIKSRYFKDITNDQNILDGIEDLFRDFAFVYPMYQALQRHSGPNYAYIFHHRRLSSLSDLAGANKMNNKVPTHGDELLTLFNWNSTFPGVGEREEDKQVTEKLVKMWINFAKYQTPTVKDSPVRWEEYSKGGVLHIGTSRDEMGPFGMDSVIEFYTKAYQIISPSTTEKEEL